MHFHLLNPKASVCVKINFSNMCPRNKASLLGNSTVALLQRVYIVLNHTDFTKALFDFKLPCGVTVHVISTDTEQTFTKLTLGENLFCK